MGKTYRQGDEVAVAVKTRKSRAVTVVRAVAPAAPRVTLGDAIDAAKARGEWHRGGKLGGCTADELRALADWCAMVGVKTETDRPVQVPADLEAVAEAAIQEGLYVVRTVRRLDPDVLKAAWRLLNGCHPMAVTKKTLDGVLLRAQAAVDSGVK